MKPAILNLHHSSSKLVSELKPHCWRGFQFQPNLSKDFPKLFFSKTLKLWFKSWRVPHILPLRMKFFPEGPQKTGMQLWKWLELDTKHRLHNRWTEEVRGPGAGQFLGGHTIVIMLSAVWHVNFIVVTRFRRHIEAVTS
jgi:hypothetical protein